MNELLILLIALAFPVSVLLYSWCSKGIKIKNVKKYIALYRLVIGRTLSEQNENASKFYTYWAYWITCSAFAEAEKKINGSNGTLQSIAWQCIFDATDALGRTLLTHSTYLNHMHEYDQSPWRITEIKDCINFLKCSGNLNSFKDVANKYQFPEYEIKFPQ